MRKIEAVAKELLHGEWCSSSQLANIQNRFGASLLILRRGDFDGRCWDIEKAYGEDGWLYRFKGFLDKYEPCSPRCLNCGSTNVLVRDDRSLGE